MVNGGAGVRQPSITFFYMPTLNEISYNILNIARSGIANDDDRMSMRQIKFWVRYHRALLVKGLAEGKAYLEPQYFQDMGCVTLEEVDKSECPDTPWGCTVKKVEIPRIVDLSRNRGIAFIGLLDKQTPITITTPGVVGFAKYKKYTNKMMRAYFINDELYVEMPKSLDKDICHINIRAVFEDPMKVNFCDTEGGCSCLTDDDEYPLPLNAIEPLVQSILEKEVSPLLGNINDEMNDARELSAPSQQG